MDRSRMNYLAACFLLLLGQGALAEVASTKGFFVKFNSEKAAVSTLSQRSLRLGIASVDGFQTMPGLKYVEVAPGQRIDAAMIELSRWSDVEYVAPNYRRHINDGYGPQMAKAPAVVPAPIEKPQSPTEWKDDPRRASNNATGLANAPWVWKNASIGSPDIIIADIDTGVDYNHRDLASNMWHNAGEEGVDAEGRDKRTNGVDDDGNGYIDDFIGWDFVHNNNLPYDDHSHGTHTSGIAAAVGGNGWGTSGVCPRCSVMALKFISADGWGDDLAAARSVDYAIRNGARILNCSWGGDEFSPGLLEAFKAADRAGIISVVAAGNDGKNIDTSATYPASFNLPNQLTVAALYPVHMMMPFWSNWGPWTVHVSQAGHDSLSTVPGDKFMSMSGTSMATPGIAGTVGMIWSYRPNLTAAEVKELIRKNILGDRDSMSKTKFRGRPDLKKIIQKLSVK